MAVRLGVLLPSVRRRESRGRGKGVFFRTELGDGGFAIVLFGRVGYLLAEPFSERVLTLTVIEHSYLHVCQHCLHIRFFLLRQVLRERLDGFADAEALLSVLGCERYWRHVPNNG